jgi:hypothetical protein
MRKKSTYCDAFRELVVGANKRLAIWNGLSSIRLNQSRLWTFALRYQGAMHIKSMGKVIAHHVQ